MPNCLKKSSILFNIECLNAYSDISTINKADLIIIGFGIKSFTFNSFDSINLAFVSLVNLLYS